MSPSAPLLFQLLPRNFAAQPPFLVRRVFYRGLPYFATDSGNRGPLPPAAFSSSGKQKAGPTHGNRPEEEKTARVGLFLLHVGLEVDSRRHLLQLFQPGFGWVAVRAVRVQLNGFLISLDRPRRKLRHLLISHF